MKKSKSKNAMAEIQDFFDKVSGKKEVNFFGEIFKNQGTSHKKNNRSKNSEFSDFDTPEDYAEEYADDYDDEDEAMDDYDDNY